MQTLGLCLVLGAYGLSVRCLRKAPLCRNLRTMCQQSSDPEVNDFMGALCQEGFLEGIKIMYALRKVPKTPGKAAEGQFRAAGEEGFFMQQAPCNNHPNPAWHTSSS